MSAADRMVVRTPAGYRSVPRRVGLGMISAGRAKLATREGTDAPLAPADEPQAAVVPATPESAPTPQEHTQTTAPDVDAGETTIYGQAFAETFGNVSTEPIEVPGSMLPALMGDVPARELPPEPKPTARRGEWADYADSLGIEVTAAMTKREIQHAAQEAATSLANLPQPALTGGRLETPEDEPATETVADDQDPRTR
jgi:hypothetical protein